MSNKGLGSSLIPQLTSSESKSLNHSVRVHIYGAENTLTPSLISLMVSVDVKHHVYVIPAVVPSAACVAAFWCPVKRWMEGDWPNHDHDRWSLNQFLFSNAATRWTIFNVTYIATLKKKKKSISPQSSEFLDDDQGRLHCWEREKRRRKKRFKIRYVCRFTRPIRLRKFTILCNRYRCARS